MPEALDEIELRSEEVQDVLSDVPHWMIRWGSTLFFVLILMLLVISWFVKYPDIIESGAIITTQIPPQKEYAKITGKIQEILIADNQLVENETPLAILENTANFKDIYKLKTVLEKVKSNNTSFAFPIDSLPMLFLGDIESDFALFENSYIQYTLNKKLQPFINEEVANEISLAELNGRLGSLRAQRELNRAQLNFKRKDLGRNKTLFGKGIISAQDYENKQLEVLQSERDLKNMNVSISQIREAISGAQNISLGTEFNKAKEEMTLLKNVIQSFNQLKKSIRDWEMRYVLKSNINGKVTFLNFWDKNQTVNQGDLVFTIIPTESTSFIAKLKAPSLNSGKIKIGQDVNIKLENYPDVEFGMLRGKVNNVSLIPDDNGLYSIDVNLPKELITTYNKEIDFRQEMRGRAEIITEDLRLIERFFYQFKELVKR